MSIQTKEINIMPNYYGYATTYNDFDKYVKRGYARKYGNFFTSIPETNSDITFDSDVPPSIVDNNLLFIFQQRATINATNFFIENPNKINIVKFILEMTSNLLDLHMKTEYIHQDLKLDNIVYDKNTDQFQLIDFGLSLKFSFDEKFIIDTAGTPLYYLYTNFQKYRSFYYDWYCLYLIIMQLLKVVSLNEKYPYFILSNLPSNFSSLNNKNINEFGKTETEKKQIRDLHYNLIFSTFKNSPYVWTMYDLLNIFFESRNRQETPFDKSKNNTIVFHDLNGVRYSINVFDQQKYEYLIENIILQDFDTIKKIFNIPNVTISHLKPHPSLDPPQKQQLKPRPSLELPQKHIDKNKLNDIKNIQKLKKPIQMEREIIEPKYSPLQDEIQQRQLRQAQREAELNRLYNF
jgi:serine/threonine protein kinase